MITKFNAKHAAEKRYSRADWDEVSDNPELTAEEISNLRPAKEVLPSAFFKELDKARKSRGRPKLENAKEAVTLRLDPAVVERFKATGENWRAKMVEAVEAAKP
ncbi:MAG: BrnA antitoxin family protein [Rhizobiaceae bacterium]